MLMLLALATAPAGAATPWFGLEYTPLSRGDLTWVNDQRTSGTGVGEFDGMSRPDLQGWFGAWFTDRFALAGSVGVARLQNTTWVEDTFRQRHWGVVRPAIDARFGLTKPADNRPHPWVVLGMHGDIPSSRDISNGYSKKEQRVADDNAATERARLGGLGGRFGFGVELPVHQAVTIGAQYTVFYHRSVLQGTDATAVSSWLSGEASLLLAFRWPKDKS